MPRRCPENPTLTEGAAPGPGERIRAPARGFTQFIGPATALLALANLILYLRAPLHAAPVVPLSPFPSGYALFITVLVPLFLAGSSFWNYRISGPTPLPRLTVASEWAGLLLLPLLGLAAHLAKDPRSLFLIQGCLYLLMIMVRLGGSLVLSRVRLSAPRDRLWPIIAGLPLVVYLGLFFWLGTTSSTTGDEPYYLMVADSMAHDLDVSLDNQFRRSRYQAYYWGERLLPQNMFRSDSGWKTTAYTTLFPLLLAPGSWLHPRWGPTLIVILVSALLAAQIFKLTFDLTRDSSAAFFAWASASFSLPLASFSSQIYPETTAALMACLLLRGIVRQPVPGERPPSSTLSVLLSSAVLPLLKARYLPLSLAGLLLWGGRSRRLRRLAVITGCAAAVLVLLAVVDRHFLGGTLFAARFGTLKVIFRFRNLVRFLPTASAGLLADQEFGLLFHSPLYLLLPAGVALALLRKDTRSALVAVPVAAYLIVLVGHFGHLWYGGFSQPGRYLVVLIPLLAPFLGWAWKEARGPWLSGVTVAAAVWSAALSLSYFLLPSFRNNQADGVNGILKALRQATGFPTDRFFPSLVNADAWSAHALLLLWLILLLPSVLVLLTRPGLGAARARHAAGAFLLGAAAMAAWIGLHRPTRVLEAEAMTHSGGKLHTSLARGPVWLFEEPGYVEGVIRSGGGDIRMTVTCGVRSKSRTPLLAVLLDGKEVGRAALEGGRGRHLRRQYRFVFAAAPGMHTLRLAVHRPTAGGHLSVYLDRLELERLR